MTDLFYLLILVGIAAFLVWYARKDRLQFDETEEDVPDRDYLDATRRER